MIAKVIVDILNSEVDRVFDYLVDDGSGIGIGDRVLLPFGNRTIEDMYCLYQILLNLMLQN